MADGTEAQKLDLYLPANSTAPRPLVVYIHGGGWEAGDKSACPAKALLVHGYAAASLNYRLSQEAIYPAQIEDCKAAIRWLRAHAGEYGIEPSRIGVWGDSAGGHLVALLGTTGDIRDFDVGQNLDQSSAVQCVVDWYGPADFLHWGEHPDPSLGNARSMISRLLGGPFMTRLDLARRASPLYFVNAHSAPFLIMHGDQDPTVPLQQSQALNAALQKAGVSSTLEVIAGAAHGGPAFGSPKNAQLIANFFDLYLRPSSPAR